MTEKKFRPTARDLRAWWERCEGHLAYCKKEDCDLGLFFIRFKQERQGNRILERALARPRAEGSEGVEA